MNAFGGTSGVFHQPTVQALQTNIEDQKKQIETLRTLLKETTNDLTEKLTTLMGCCKFEIPTDVKKATEILNVALDLKLDALIVQCSQVLENNMNDTSCINVYQFAKEKNIGYLQCSAYDYILKHFCNVHRADDFQNLSVHDVQSILASDHLDVEHEAEVLDAVVEWVQSDPENRKKHVEWLVQTVRLPLCDQSFLSTLKYHFLVYDLKTFQEEVKRVSEGQKLGSQDVADSAEKMKRNPRR